MNPELVFYSGSTLLESPCWDAKNRTIYCVSIERCIIYGINTKTQEIKNYPTNGQVGCVAIRDDGMLISAEKEGIYEIDPQSGKRKFITQIEKDIEMRYNDGKLDPLSNFLVGAKGYLEEKPNKGKLYWFDGKTTKVLISGATISNGIDFSPCGNKLYFIDTPTKKVDCYKYDAKQGVAEFERCLVKIPDAGYPDGMCVDKDGDIWVAEWEGGKVCKWDVQTGKKLQEIRLPCKRVTSCCLGGENLDYLYITTAKSNDSLVSGGLFRVRLQE